MGKAPVGTASTRGERHSLLAGAGRFSWQQKEQSIYAVMAGGRSTQERSRDCGLSQYGVIGSKAAEPALKGGQYDSK